MRNLGIAITTIVASVLLAGTTLADTIHVPGDYPTIQGAVDAASDGDEIVVAPGTYTSTQDGHVVDMKGKAVTLRSSDGPEVTVIDGENARRGIACFNGGTDATLIEGFTITNGNGTWYDYNGDGSEDFWEESGGGIFCYQSSPTITDCTIEGNTAENGGGGIYCDDSSPTISGCTISGNTAEYGGGMSVVYNCSPTLEKCTFAGNSSAYGGGLMNSGSPTLVGCSFLKNTVRNDGGGMHINWYSNPTLIDCTFTGNTAGWYGGGIRSHTYSSPTLTGCSFENNTAERDGGGLYTASNSNPTLSECTFENNTAGSNGGGICNYILNTNPTLVHCEFTGNTAAQGGGIYNYPGSIPVLENCTFHGNSAVNGGGMYNDFASPTLTDCALVMNSAVDKGGGMFNMNSSPTLNGCSFTNNSVQHLGSGMYNSHYSNPVLTQCTFVKHQGNAMTNFLSDPLVMDCVFEYNGDGGSSYCGGIFLDTGSSPTLIGCTFRGNLGPLAGGVYMNDQCSPVLDSCIFIDNTAVYGLGGGIQSYSNNTSIMNTLFCGNDPTHINGDWVNEGGNEFYDECSNACPGDATGDGYVDVNDVLYVISAWDTADPNADFDDNGLVDVDDILILLSHFGETCP